MPGFTLPCRSTLVRLSSGELLLHSPVSLNPEVVAAVQKSGQVTRILAPNLYHHLFLSEAQAKFPSAQTIAPVGLSEKSKDLRVDSSFDPTHLPDLGEDFSCVLIEGATRFSEVVLLHKPSQTLIVGDYFFNIQRTRGLLTPWLLRLTGSYKKATQSKLWRKVTDDKALMKKSAQAVLDLDFRRVIMCHGDVIEDGREMAKCSLSWLLDA
jgi:hypothetical protein